MLCLRPGQMMLSWPPQLMQCVVCAFQGTWTAEQDEQLRTLVEAKGRKWTEIGHIIGRMGESCRDRWRRIGMGVVVKGE